MDGNEIKRINEDIEGDEKYKDAIIDKKVLSIIKINHPKYKNCLIYKDYDNIIKMIIINNKWLKFKIKAKKYISIKIKYK